MTISEITAGRSFLFAPGDRPERFSKALAAGADVVIIDLEDAVAPASKDCARRAVAQWLDSEKSVVLRINAADTEWFEADLELCGRPGVAAILLPKSIAGASLERVAAGRPTIALVESAQGILDIARIAATDGVMRLAFGAIDLALELDATAGEAVFDPFRLQMVVSSRAAGLAGPIDGVTRDFRNPAFITRDVAHARSLGMAGKLCVHPAQIGPTHAAFAPSAHELAVAERILAADAAAGGAAVSLDGLMIDRPVVERARRLLRSAP